MGKTNLSSLILCGKTSNNTREQLFLRGKGLEYLNIKEDVEQPTIRDHDVLIKVKSAGVNPIDYITVSNIPGIKPLPHIPGAEVTGIIEKVGNHVADLKEGDKVVVHNRIFDGTCDMCLNGYEMLCRNGGIIGVNTNGGFADYIAASEKNVFTIPDDVQWEVAANLATSTITPYHALKEASLKLNECLAIFGASGNTGTMAVQFGKKMGARVIAVSKDSWIKTGFGADYIISDYDIVDQVQDITQDKMADVVLNSLGVNTWENSFSCVGLNGRWVTFGGGLTGAEVKLNVQSLYSKQIK